MAVIQKNFVQIQNFAHSSSPKSPTNSAISSKETSQTEKSSVSWTVAFQFSESLCRSFARCLRNFPATIRSLAPSFRGTTVSNSLWTASVRFPLSSCMVQLVGDQTSVISPFLRYSLQHRCKYSTSSFKQYSLPSKTPFLLLRISLWDTVAPGGSRLCNPVSDVQIM